MGVILCSIVATEFLMDGSCVGIWIRKERWRKQEAVVIVNRGWNKQSASGWLYRTLDYTIIELATTSIIVNQVNLL